VHLYDAFVDCANRQRSGGGERATKNVPASRMPFVDCGSVRDVAWMVKARRVCVGLNLSYIAVNFARKSLDSQSANEPPPRSAKLTFGHGVCRVWTISIPFEVTSDLNARIEFRLEEVVFIEEQDDVDILQDGRADHVAERA